MSALLGELGAASLDTLSETLAFTASGSAHRSLEPFSLAIAQKAWQIASIRALDALTAAAVAAENVDEYERMKGEASFNGLDAQRFADLYGVVLEAPEMGELLTMLRRDTITEDQFKHGLRKARLEALWDVPLDELKNVRLAPAQIALGIVRSVIKDPGLLAVTLDTADSNVARYPQASFDAIAEAAAAGIDEDRLRTLVGEVGLPMPAVRAASAFFRSILTRGAYNQAILEGDTRPEWADAILDEARQIPTAHEFIEGRLRAWIDDQAMLDGTAMHGMTQEHTDLLFKVAGRPLSFHQVFIGLRRGGIYDGPTNEIDPAFLKSLQESNIRPEWYNIAWAQRHVYPSMFVLRALTESHDYTAQQTETILLYEGWEPTLAHDTATKWYATKSATGSTLSSKAKTSALTALHKSYVDDLSDETFARSLMTELGEPESEQAATIAIWNHERAIRRASLTAKQITNAIGTPGHDEAWATARLSELGYNADEISALLGK